MRDARISQDFIKSSVREKTYSLGVFCFVVLHLSALIWWLIPAQGYPTDEHRVGLPLRYLELESKLSSWKRDVSSQFIPRLLEEYIYKTATWQKWWMFAPNPVRNDDSLSVYAVTGWKNRLQAIYDPLPLFQAYGGLRGGAVGVQCRDSKLIENLSSGEWNKVLPLFAEHWGRVYETRHGRKPLGIHVILRRSLIPRTSSERMTASSTPVSESLLWYLHYPLEKKGEVQ